MNYDANLYRAKLFADNVSDMAMLAHNAKGINKERYALEARQGLVQLLLNQNKGHTHMAAAVEELAEEIFWVLDNVNDVDVGLEEFSKAIAEHLLAKAIPFDANA